MKNKPDSSSSNIGLRELAEKKLTRQTDSEQDLSKMSPEETAHILHELRVHQIELEMQNEQLRLTQQELEQARDKYSDLYDFAPVGYCTLSNKGIIIQCNLTLCSLLDVNRSSLLGKRFSAFIHQKDRDNFYLFWNHLQKVKTARESQFRMLAKDGQRFFTDLHATVVVEPESEKQQIHLAVTNISAQRAASDALYRERDLLKNITDTSPIGIVVTDETGQITFVNREAENILGLEKETITRRVYDDPLWKITDFDGKPFPEEQLPFAIVKDTCKSVYNVQHAIQWADGKRTLLSVNATPQLDESGKFQGMVAAIQDVTDKVKSEKALKREMERASHYLKIAGTMFVSLDKNQVVTLVNPKACEILGYPEKEIIGKNWFDNFIPQKNANNVKTVFNNIVSGQLSPVEYYENPVLTKSGEERIIAWHNSILRDETGQIIGLLSAGEDITARKQAEREILKNQEALLNILEDLNNEIEERKKIEAEIVKSETKFREIFESAGEGIIYVNNKGTILEINQSLEKITGVDRNTIVGKNVIKLVKELLTPKDIKWILPAVTRVFSGKNIKNFELTFRDKILEIGATYRENSQRITGIIRDITVRKKMENSLRESEERFRTYINSSPTAIFISDADGHYQFVNDAACQLLGYTEKELLTKHISELSHPDSPPDDLKSFTTLQETGRVTQTITLQQKNGTAVFVLLDGVKLDENRYMGFCTDITNLKKTEAALQNQVNETQWMLQSMINAFVIFDSVFDNNGNFVSYRFVYINAAYERITGMKNDKVRGKTVHEVWPKTEDSWIEYYGSVAVTGKSRSFEMYHDPTKKWYYCNVYRPGDTADRFCVIFDDITEKRKTEEEIRLSEERFRTLFNQAAEMIFLHDMDGKIIDINEQTIQQYGYTRDELLKMKTMDIDPDYVRRENKGLFWKMFKKQNNVAFQGRHQRKDGSIFPVEVTLSKIQLGDDHYVLALTRDVSEYVNLIEKLEESEKQLRALTGHLQSVREDERKAIAREIHDEVAQILTALKIDITLFGSDLQTEFPEVVKKHEADIQSMRDMIDESIRQIRALIRQLRPEYVDSMNLIEALRLYLHDITENKKLNVHFRSYIDSLDFGPDQNLAIFRIFQEALSNINRHANAENIYISINTKESEIILKIRDDGKGIETAKTEKKDHFGIIGMQERAIFLGGTLTVTGIKERGTEVVLRIPEHRETA